jgi:hypothetical protein
LPVANREPVDECAKHDALREGGDGGSVAECLVPECFVFSVAKTV